MKRINGCNLSVTSDRRPQTDAAFSVAAVPSSRRLRRRSLRCPGAGDSLGKLPESCYSYGSPVLRRIERIVAFVSKEEMEVRVPAAAEEEDGSGDGVKDADPQDLEYVRQIQRVLELLKKNRDMLFNEVRLTIMIEDAKEVERWKLSGIEDPDAPTRDDLVVALEQVLSLRTLLVSQVCFWDCS